MHRPDFKAPKFKPSRPLDDDKPDPKLSGRAHLNVELKQLKSNYRAVTELLARKGKPVTLAAVVKADAYGLGMGPIAKSIYGQGCRSFFVATPAEGRLLREIIGPAPSIYVLNGPTEAELHMLFSFKLKPVLNSYAQARMWVNAIRKHEFQPRTVIHYDTGINRMGFDAEDFKRLTNDKEMLKTLDVELFMSHLACADDSKNPMNGVQLDAFKRAAAKMPPVALSLANSGGIYLGKDYHFNMVRSGGALYGLSISDVKPVHSSVVTLTAPVLQTRVVKTGQPIGYGGTYIAKRNMIIAIVAAGYGDGIPLEGSNISFATFKGQRLPIVGKVSMDLTTLDVTDIRGGITEKDRVEFLGSSTEDQSDLMGTLNYNLFTRLGSRIRKTYIK